MTSVHASRPSVDSPLLILRSPHLTLWQWVVILAFLLAMFFQMTRAALRNSVTFDEGQHISRGYVYLTAGDLRFHQIRGAHPPAMAILEAAPLLLLPNMPSPSALRGWAEADTVLFARQLLLKSPDIEKLLFAARVPVMLVAVLMAAFVFRWANDLSTASPFFRPGPVAGCVALGLCAFDPNIIAHGMIAANDLGMTAYSFMTLYWLWKSLRRPTLGRLIMTGFTLGLALTAKMPALLLLPISALVILIAGMTHHRKDYFAHVPFAWRVATCPQAPSFRAGRALRLRRLIGLVVVATIIYAVGFLTVWAIYRFEFRQLPGLPIPIPAATHVKIILESQKHLDVGHPAFLMGQVSERGWWYYFPVAFLIKTPIPTLILLFASVALSIRPRVIFNRQHWLAILPLVIFVGTYGVVAIFSSVNIGYRHLLPVLPCLFVLASQISNLKSQVGPLKLGVRYLIFGALALWYIVGTVALFPNYLTFFNELVGGPKNGYKYLVDSNLDWGQSLIELRAYIARNHLGRINLSATGYVNPAVYGIVYDPLPPMQNPQPVVHFDPKPGRYYIGAHNLQIGSPIDHDVFGWFREREPNEWIANAILVYDVPERPAGKWVAQCAAPLAPLTPEAIAEGFGRNDLRLIEFDCQTSWVYPATAPGWYIVGNDSKPLALSQQLVLEFRTSELSQGARFTVYRQNAGPDLNGISTQITAVSGDTPTPGSALRAPVSVGPLMFLGFTLDRSTVTPGQTVMLTTYWRVMQPVDRLVSLMGHLIAPDGRVIANGDGLGVPIEFWQPGDVIVQHHPLTVPRGTPPGTYLTQTGFYTLEDMQRFGVQSEGIERGDRLVLGSVEVK